ncbi:hypothetical protein SEA_NIOBE_43 [Arthrobacter phage Niobe]|uniref:Uncharacterized protein n=1 Tax=Arthrobacter phage Elezi TaxID=2762410 RepID=A0A7G8LH21_9CAUD|nr:hypothetical protein PQE13_gp43 [Arthrobacter phage Elezi]QNJ56543.1 hypothetical protein SEA_ELEZI_43 [Arthrobacter phage Elezi]QOP64346.1 hypothetical protein SEA_LONDON_43 [Arthrobacter phage London]UAJ15404.1 hypothetical protein SEA_ASA16_43 [Arthrobacter phage Asa16]
MANTYEKLIEAGAPAIVEPLFYRLYQEYGTGTIVVEVRERRQYKGSDLKARRKVELYGLPSEIPARVADAATECVMEIDTASVVASLVGVASSTGREDV